eukprot:3993170-Prymnesium_polylepis.1
MSARPTISEAVAILLKNDLHVTKSGVFREAAELLWKIVTNILQHPDDESMRRLKRSSKAFSAKLAPAKGAVRFLRAVGFEEHGEGDEAALQMGKPDIKLLEEGKAALKACVKEYARLQEEARRIENEAAAEKLRMLQQVSRSNQKQARASPEPPRTHTAPWGSGAHLLLL